MKFYKKRFTAAIMSLMMLVSGIPFASAGQENSYHDPADNWLESANRTEELDVNAVVTKETVHCFVCGESRVFTSFRTPEYTRDGQTALNRNVKYSDGTMIDGAGTGSILDGTPGKDASYTGYHWTKAVCDTCSTINSNMYQTDYGFNKNVYWLYDCAEDFMQTLPETVTYAYADDTYHTKTTESGSYCGFCYGTHYTSLSALEKHNLEQAVTPQPANARFADGEHCTDCDYENSKYISAKSVIADYYGVVDGEPHTVTVTDLSESGVTTQIRYGNSADSCTMTSAPNFTEEGQYTVYYEITYTYKNTDMTENGVAYVWLRNEHDCGCTNPDCGCNDLDCDGTCCVEDENGCNGDHNYMLLENIPATCKSLGYDRYGCTECGKVEKRNYVESLGHAYQGIVVREATCETDGKLMEICSRCSEVKVSSTPKSEHEYTTYPVAATCTSSGYTVKECTVCGDRHITDITSALSHNYHSHVTAATCEAGGHTVHSCDSCGSSFITDYTDPLGHNWDEGTLITNATCTGEGILEFTCIRCGVKRLDGNAANGHKPGEPATCTEPQLCTECGAVIQKALGHDYKSEVTKPTCTEMGYTTHTCTRCDDSYESDYTEPSGHKPSDWIIDKEPTTDTDGSKHKECTECGEKLDEEVIEKLYNQGTTDSKGEATVGEYLVIVTDTDTKNPIANAIVTLKNDDSFTVKLPDNRLLDFADKTTVTVLIKEDKSPVPDRKIAVSDKNDNYSADITDKLGQITVPTGSGSTNDDGNATIGNENSNKEEITLTVKVEDYETKRPIKDCEISIGNSGNIIVKLPDGVDMDENNRITVTVTDNKKNPQPDRTVIVNSDLGESANGKTNKDGKLTVPSLESDYTDENGIATVGKYTVIVTDTEKIPVVNALVTLISGNPDTFTVLLPNGRLLDGNDQTIVTVLLPNSDPANNLNIKVSDVNNNHAAKNTDINGQIIVPDCTGSSGEIIGTDTGDDETSNTVRVDVTDEDGNLITDAEISVDNDGNIDVTLPDDFTFEEDGLVTVTVTDNEGNAKPDVSVTVQDGDNVTTAGQTDNNGAVTLPDKYHFAYIVGYKNGNIGPELNMSRAEAATMFARILAESRGDSIISKESKFPDVDKNAWYADYVTYLENMGIICGYTDGNFYPEAYITRAEFITMCCQLKDWIPLETYQSNQGMFPDISSNYWAAKYISEAVRNGWIVGYTDGNFHGENFIIRAEVVTTVNNMLGRTPDEDFIRQNEKLLHTFHDLQDPHYWAYYEMMEAANGHTIISGADDEIWHEVK